MAPPPPARPRQICPRRSRLVRRGIPCRSSLGAHGSPCALVDLRLRLRRALRDHHHRQPIRPRRLARPRGTIRRQPRNSGPPRRHRVPHLVAGHTLRGGLLPPDEDARRLPCRAWRAHLRSPPRHQPPPRPQRPLLPPPPLHHAPAPAALLRRGPLRAATGGALPGRPVRLRAVHRRRPARAHGARRRPPPSAPSSGGNRRRRKGKSGGGDRRHRAPGAAPTGGGTWPSFFNPWTGTIRMWPDRARRPLQPHAPGLSLAAPSLRAPPPARRAARLPRPRGAVATRPALSLGRRWAALGRHSVPRPPGRLVSVGRLAPGRPPGLGGPVQPSGSRDQQALAGAFNTMTLTPPPTGEWYMDSGATAHMASTSGPRTRRVIRRCNSSGPLYPLLPSASPSPSALLASASSQLWHRRLGHLGHDALSKLAGSSRHYL
ncbi:hypothetical protein U9M48_029359 [Paspalum notatum var. saurae]|uniref:GAG-pre-integrase domain-containing protein n=1 Tax=Paspalum notatum var. saurae TaxID=547442 RepID=A0AAQ3X133_PASNO